MTWQVIVDSVFNFVALNALFFGVLAVVVLIVKKTIDLLVDRYFRSLYLRAGSRKGRANEKRFNTLSNAIRKVAGAVLWVIIILVILIHFGVDVTLLLSGAGALGLIIGITGKDVIKDLYTGFMVLLENQYTLGDIIKINDDHSGTVEDISLRTVILRDIDGNRHIVPHSLATSIINMTADFSRVRIEVGVAYDSDLQKVKEVIDEVGQELANDPDWDQDIRTPIAFDRVLQFDESAITVRIIGDVAAGRQWAVSGEYNTRLKAAFDANDIEIPFPQRTLHMIHEESKK